MGEGKVELVIKMELEVTHVSFLWKPKKKRWRK